ncbi:MAG: bifunctional indole-3-glycerol phosphate synthase/phosphoribosylanthranilate isomerase [Treponema sp.]|nr:bifunctional indole-3-glycerol phosphate synthase/phosphoribosylanthranilate isomerase [Treponema sp.]
MSANILNEIVSERKKRIAQFGYGLGYTIPEKRTRPIVPFMVQKGAILEIKRASPSKGDIAPLLDARKTAQVYAESGAAAISVLTEEAYFKGNLDDLTAVCSAVDTYTTSHKTKPVAVLRKDFLIAPEEVSIAYACGADAVLLIARILDTETLIAMAKECQKLGITALIELRLSDDLQKLQAVIKQVQSTYIVCGVNARDLKDFSIDLLTPVGLLKEIKKIIGSDARVIFESGIRTPLAAEFAGSLGFTGMLLGEAAARHPENAQLLVHEFIHSRTTATSQFWIDYAQKLRIKQKKQDMTPFMKICGITNVDDAVTAAMAGAEFIGCIFCKKSPRNIAITIVPKIWKALKAFAEPPKLIGVITDIDSPESKAAIELQHNGILDCIQLHGKKAYQQFFATDLYKTIAHYPVVSITKEEDLEEIHALRLRGEPRILVDAKVGESLGGTGTQIEQKLVDAIRLKTKLWLAGGMTPDNIVTTIQKWQPELIDTASGVESTPGKKDEDKVKKICLLRTQSLAKSLSPTNAL